MPEDTRSDEDLVSAYLKGDLPDGRHGKPALEILLNRYSAIILSYLFGLSFFAKDEQYLDDIHQEVLITVFNEIRKDKDNFTPAGPGSFKRWVFKIAYFECLKQDKKRRKGSKTISEIFPDEETGIPDDLVFDLTPRVSEYDQASDKLKDAFSKLSDEEIKLMKLVSQDMKYKEITQYPEFRKYSFDALKQKIYNIRKRVIKNIL